MHSLKKENQSGGVNKLKLFLVHTGYYDKKNSDGFYEQHTNIFVIAKSVYEAREKVKQNEEYIDKKMHIDGIKEIINVEGYDLELKKGAKPQEIITYSHHQIRFLKPQ